ncbi:MAG: pyridoxal phosphate-dependent aminotransferase [Opitutales bacterium]|nr:pyridoxal phosphate-dependent aminotransferase [Opitutales bacterium]NRA26749.1 pyridoxal phosphate-dependent aminotransferase [Opitutales bacterium]
MSITDKLSTWVKNVAPSPTLAVDAKAKALKAKGVDVCGFGAGEPDFDTPDFIKEAAIQALKDGETKYSLVPGIAPLRQALAEKYTNENDLTGVKPTQFVVSPGGKYSCTLAIRAVCDPGDEVIILGPYWVSYPEMVKQSGGIPRIVSSTMDDGFKVSLERIKASITDKTKMVVLNSPSNPTGAIYEKSEIQAIAELCASKGIFLMSDEIYEYLLYDGATHFSPASMDPEISDWVITVGGFSKTFSMTGWRLGTLLASEPVAKAVSNLQSQTTSGATTFAQYGALAALENRAAARAAIADMLIHFDRRRLMLVDGLNAIDGIRCFRSQGAFYVFPDISGTGLSSDVFSERILEEHQVALASGTGFGAEGYLRLSYATSDAVIQTGLEKIKSFVGSL